MPKKRQTPVFTTIMNPETNKPAQFPLNRAARKAMKKHYNLDVLPPPVLYPRKSTK